MSSQKLIVIASHQTEDGRSGYAAAIINAEASKEQGHTCSGGAEGASREEMEVIAVEEISDHWEAIRRLNGHTADLQLPPGAAQRHQDDRPWHEALKGIRGLVGNVEEKTPPQWLLQTAKAAAEYAEKDVPAPDQTCTETGAELMRTLFLAASSPDRHH